MADAQRLSPGDTGYDPTTDPDSPSYGQNQGDGGGANTWWTQNAPPASAGETTAVSPGVSESGGKPEIQGASDTNELGALNSLLLKYPDVQQAVDAFNQQFPNSVLKPAYYPHSGKGVIGVQGQSLPYLTAPGTTDGQTGWNFGGVPGGDANSGGGAGPLADGSLIAPFTGSAPTPKSTPGFNYPSFSPPSAQDVLTNDPGYQFRKDQGQGAIANRYAAQGILNTGGAEKGFIDYSQSAASQEYANAFQRALGIYGTNYQTALGSQQQNFNQNTTSNNYDFAKYLNDQNVFWTNQGNAFSRLAQQQGVGLSAASAS